MAAAADDTAGKAAPGKRLVAVALRYAPGEADDAPKVVASGKGHVAEKMLDLAFAHGVKVREDADLAQILGAVEVDSFIPVEAFVAVAEILAYVYRAGARPPPLPAPAAPRPAP